MSQTNISLGQRPTWEEYFKNITIQTATRSPCERLQVGCVLVKNNRIIAQGYNGFLPGCPHQSIVENNHEQATVHAEANAIADCAKRGVSSEGCTAFVTHFPCINCMKLMCAAGISEIKYINDYKNDPKVTYLSEITKVNISQI